MTANRADSAIATLRWILALVLLAESVRFAFSASAAAAFAKTGLPEVVHVGLAWAEMIAAVIFLIPRTLVLGGRTLLAVLAFAIILHLLHGWYDVGALVVYAAATRAVIAWQGPSQRLGTNVPGDNS
jgi:hypothetical protein